MAAVAYRTDEKDASDRPSDAGRPSLLAGYQNELCRKEELSLELCESMIDIAAELFGLPSKEIRRQGRTTLQVVRVRQVAMYVAHVVLGLTTREIGRGFGRNHTTVQHACHVVEDMRDEAAFDQVVARTERIAAILLRSRIGR